MYNTSDLLKPSFLKLQPEATIREVLQAFLQYRVDVACVVDIREKLIGLCTKYRIYRQILDGASLETAVELIPRREILTIGVDENLDSGRQKLLKANMAHAVVVADDDRVLGVITKSDLIQGFFWERDILVNRLNSIIHNIPLSILVIDRERKILHYNKQTQEILGSSEESITGRLAAECLPELGPHLDTVFHTRQKLALNKIAVRNLNSFVLMVPLIEFNQIDTVLVILQELASLENVALELNTTQGLMRTLETVLNKTYDVMIVTDALGHIRFYSQDLGELLNTDLANLEGQTLSQIIPSLAQKKLALLPDDFNEVASLNDNHCLITVHKIWSHEEIYGYIVKITYKQINHLKALLTRLQALESLVDASHRATGGENQSESLKKIITVHSRVQNIKAELPLIAQTNSTVLILGESGTGKELIAAAVHDLSARTGQFIKINCASIPAELLESELFGYEEGAFTGARKGGKPGKFELADKGTIFLDEIGDMPMALQAKLLRVLEEKCFERIGGTKTLSVDIRFVAATNKDLSNLMAQGKFREDLFYRLNVINFEIPPLRERLEDIPVLVRHYLNLLNEKYGKNIIDVAPDVMQAFLQYSWHGNIRELINVLERAVLGCNEPILSVSHLNRLNFPLSKDSLKSISREVDLNRQTLVNLLLKFRGNKSQVAKALGISRVTLYKKLDEYNIKLKVDYQ